MAKQSSARLKLEQARFFMACASEAISARQRNAFVNFIEAAIVFARSVTLCLQKEYQGKTNFNRWYSEKQDIMNNDPICRFFKDKRNYVLKEGSAGIHKNITITAGGGLLISGSCEVEVIRGQPWYHRSPKILWKDLRVTIMRPIRGWLKRRETKRRQLQSQKQSKAEVSEEFFFDDPKWRDRSCLDLLQEYLDKLELIVTEGDVRFTNRT